jgi:hypothetical protein
LLLLLLLLFPSSPSFNCFHLCFVGMTTGAQWLHVARLILAPVCQRYHVIDLKACGENLVTRCTSPRIGSRDSLLLGTAQRLSHSEESDFIHTILTLFLLLFINTFEPMPSNSLGVISQGPPTDVMRHQKGLVLTSPATSVHVTEKEECAVHENSGQVIPRTLLTCWNAAMFLFHSGLLFITLYLGNRDLSVPIYRTELLFRTINVTNSSVRPWELVPSYVEAGTLPFTWLTASFFFLSALFHFLNATFLRSYYLSKLEECCTPTRYLEYTFSASVMILLISYTLGVRERMLLIASAVLIGITMPFGYWCEHLARPAGPDSWVKPFDRRIFPWVIGHIPQVTAWAIIIVNFYDENEGRAPDFVHGILWGELALFFSFGFVALYQQCTVPRNFYKGELMFQVLSLVSKGLLGGILIANVLILSSFEELYDDP